MKTSSALSDLVVLCGAILVITCSSFGGPASSASLQALAAQADAIVVGLVHANSSNGMISATIDVERALKGPLKAGNLISVGWSAPNWGGPNGPFPDDHGLFFLRQDTSGTWAALPVTAGDIKWRDVFVQTPTSVPSNITSTAARSLPPNPSPMDSVLLELVAAAEAGARFPIDFVVTYQSYRSPLLGAAFRRFARNGNPWLASAGLRDLISMADPTAVQVIQQQQAAMSSTPFWPSAVEELKVYYTSTDSVAVAALGTLAVNNKAPQDLRGAAAWALARIHTSLALPYLPELLSDPSPALQAAGVGGLASFANNVPIGSHEPAPGDWKFRTNDTIAHSAFDESLVAKRQAYYVGFWRSWWNENQVELSK